MAIAICLSSDLVDGGPGTRFEIQQADQVVPAFAIRSQGKVYAYLNRCGHQGVELDYNHGEFFDLDKRYLTCATHGALYEPSSGACVAGRCAGVGLKALKISERDGEVLLQGEEKSNLI